MRNGLFAGIDCYKSMRAILNLCFSKSCGCLDIRVFRCLLVVPILFSVIGCNQKCYILPSVELLDTAQYEGETYDLYARTTGIQEKQTFFELYKGEPELDSCLDASMKAVAIVAHDHEKYVSEIVFQPEKTNLLRISFTSQKNQGYSHTDDVKFK